MHTARSATLFILLQKLHHIKQLEDQGKLDCIVRIESISEFFLEQFVPGIEASLCDLQSTSGLSSLKAEPTAAPE